MLWPMDTTPLPQPELIPIIEPKLIPEAEIGNKDGMAWLYQALPDDLDQKGIHFAAVTKEMNRLYAMAQATSHEHDDPKAHAITMVEDFCCFITENLNSVSI